MRLVLRAVALAAAMASGTMMVVGLGLTTALDREEAWMFAYRQLERNGGLRCSGPEEPWPPSRWFEPADAQMPEFQVCRPVVARVLNPGEVVTTADVEYVAVPPDFVPDAALAEGFSGRTVVTMMLPGEFVRPERLR